VKTNQKNQIQSSRSHDATKVSLSPFEIKYKVFSITELRDNDNYRLFLKCMLKAKVNQQRNQKCNKEVEETSNNMFQFFRKNPESNPESDFLQRKSRKNIF
jgi:hypothetical protein